MIERLHYVTDAALAHLTTAELLDELLARVRVVLNVDTATALLFDPVEPVLVVVASAGAEPIIKPGARIPTGRGFAGQIALDQRAMTLNSAELVQSISPGLHRRGFTALLGAPLIIEGVVTGVIHVGALQAREFSPDDAQLLQLVADRAALALDHARLFEAERRARIASDAAVRARDEFLTIAAHELKTPLTAVKSAAQLLARRLRYPEVDRDEVNRLAAVLDGQIVRLETLVGDLLDPARLEHGGLSVERQEVDLVELGAQVLERHGYAPERKSQHILVLDAPEPVAGILDPMRVDQVLTNLISTVLRDTPDGGTISLAIHPAADQAEIVIRGQSALGAQSMSLDSTESPPRPTRGGNLLGLYITAQLVEQQRGKIYVDMEPDRDMAVTVRLPLSGAAP